MRTVCVAVPTLGLDQDPSRWLTSFIYVQKQLQHLGFEIGYCFPYRASWREANNAVFDMARDAGFEYLLRMDDDVWNVPQDAIKRLMEAGKPVIGAAYPTRHFPYSVCAYRLSPEAVAAGQTAIDIWKKQASGCVPVHGSGVQQVDLVGFGLTLVRLRDIAAFPRQMFEGMGSVPDDTWFAQLCKDHGVSQWVHMDVQLNHRHVTPWNCDALQAAERAHNIEMTKEVAHVTEI